MFTFKILHGKKSYIMSSYIILFYIFVNLLTCGILIPTTEGQLSLVVIREAVVLLYYRASHGPKVPKLGNA